MRKDKEEPFKKMEEIDGYMGETWIKRLTCIDVDILVSHLL